MGKDALSVEEVNRERAGRSDSRGPGPDWPEAEARRGEDLNEGGMVREALADGGIMRW
jgi:hypothetical protein